MLVFRFLNTISFKAWDSKFGLQNMPLRLLLERKR